MADDTPYIGWRLVVFVSVVTPLLVILTALRFYARSLTSRRFGLDDWLVLIALFGQFGATGLAVCEFTASSTWALGHVPPGQDIVH